VEREVTLPAVSPGAWYLLVLTDRDNQQGETDETNNVRALRMQLSAPDLVVTDATAPASAIVGERVRVSWAVTNQGEVPALTDWTDALYLSADERVDSSDRFLSSAGISAQTPLAAGASYTVEREATIPLVSPESWFVLVVADRDNAQGETDEGNNVRALALELAAPDLVVTAASASASAIVGQWVRVSWTVENQSDVPAPADWTDALYLSTDEQFDFGDRRVHSEGITTQTPLGAGASYTVTRDVMLPVVAPGAWFLLVMADADNAQGETDESHLGTKPWPYFGKGTPHYREWGHPHHRFRDHR
jgi:subtilase family serine protease